MSFADADSINAAIRSAKSLIFPNYNLSIKYDENTQNVFVKFTTPSDYKVNYNFFYFRWMDNQQIVLREFREEDGPVRSVTVETNFKGSKDLLRITHSAVNIEKYARIETYERWLHRGQFLTKGSNDTKWEEVGL